MKSAVATMSGVMKKEGKSLGSRHCEEQSDEAIQGGDGTLDCLASLVMTGFASAARVISASAL
ncbi:hypothetical protein [Methylocystis parvus]|uniref:hypothetical protein n=1 Tax=Methylocystis parvus TaxID=134 RepID=UPI003C74A8F4